MRAMRLPDVSSGTTVAVSVQGVAGAVPEVVELDGDHAERFWLMPQTRSLTRYGAASWSHSGLTTFTAAAINDGVITTTCAITPSGTAWLRYDAGAGATKAFRELTLYYTGTLASTPWLQYSDDAVTWTAVTHASAKAPADAGGGVTAAVIAWKAAGAHRYWRINFAAVNAFTEFHFSEYLGMFAQVREFRVYDVRSGVRKHYLSIPVGAIPIETTPLSVEPIMTDVPFDYRTGGMQLSDVLVTVVNSAGTESAGVQSVRSKVTAAAGGQAEFIPQQETTLTLTNGVNASVSLPSGPEFVRVTGPTATFSIGGLSAMAGGTTAFLCNATAYQMTVLHEYGSAAATDRIATPSGGSVIVQPGATVAFTRDSATARWRLWWDSIEWANVNGKPTAIARIQNNTGTAGSIDVAGVAGGYAGIRFPDSYQDQTLMLSSSADLQGVYRQSAGAWSWYWQNGSLVVGSVPWANVTGKPTTLGGYGITDAAPLAAPALTGTPTAPTPASGDVSNKLATTAFVDTAINTQGGSLLSTSTISPATRTGVVIYESTGRPGQMPITETTVTSTTAVNVLSITGKGRLRFLGIGHSSASGIVRLNITVDGNAIASNATFSGASSGITQSCLAVPVVGSIAGSSNGTSYFSSPIPEEAFEFKSSLVVQAYVTGGTGYIGTSYRLYS